MSTLSRFSLHLSYGARLRARRDWLVALSIAGVMLLVSAFWNYWTFSRVESGETLGQAATATPSGFDKSSLDLIRQVITSRAGEEARYLSGEYRFIDPSR